MSSQGIKKGITYVFAANILNLIFNLLSSFLLPKFLSIDAYADIKTFQLISAYIGVLSLGYVDGIYLKYGGYDINDIDSKELSIGTSSFRITQLIIFFTSFCVSLIINNIVIILSTMIVVSLNMTGYIKSLYQATGEFGRYAKATNLASILTFSSNIILRFLLNKEESFWYLISYIVLDLLIWIYLEHELSHKYKKRIKICSFSFLNLWTNSKRGILLMLGNFSSIILTSMDRWFVKGLFTTTDFALYSFAVSIEGFLNVAITPITVTLYNYFCKNRSNEAIKNLHGAVEIFSVFVVCCCFPAKFILEMFIPKYLEASKVMFLLFASQIIYTIIKSIYVNLYKARMNQRIYFIKLISVIFVGLILNIVGYLIYPYKETFAIATLLSSIYWFIISQPDFKEIGLDIIDYIYPAIGVLTLICCGFVFSSLIGLIVYLAIMIIMTLIFRKRYLSILVEMLPNRIKHIKMIKIIGGNKK